MTRSSRLFTVTALVLILLYALVPLMMLMDSSLAETLIMKNRPGLSARELQFATAAVIIFTTAIHLLFMGLTLWLSIMAVRRRKWAHIALTAVLSIATFGSFSSWMAGPSLYPVIIATTIIHLVLLVLLWLPGHGGVFHDANGK